MRETVSSVDRFVLKSYMVLVLFLIVDGVFSIRIGMISSTTFITSRVSEKLDNTTCPQCTCAALVAGAVGWNCFANNVTCQLIGNYSLGDGHLVATTNGSFFFQKSPPEPLLTVSDTIISSTSAGTTATSIMTSTMIPATTAQASTAASTTTSSNYDLHRTLISWYKPL